MTTWKATFPLPTMNPCPLGTVQAVGELKWPGTLVVTPTPYLIVGLDVALAEKLAADLERGRILVGRAAGIVVSRTVPKLAVVDSVAGYLRYRTRLAAGGSWHNRIASSGLLALGVALAQPGSVPRQVLGTVENVVRVSTPAGVRLLQFRPCPDGSPGIRLRLADVQVLEEAA